jgi:putative tryptophan/tyrosine transport system substrate-binding protein
MRRREFITLMGGATATILPLGARAQQAGKIPRIGFMGNSTAALEANLLGAFRAGLREHGYEEGRTIVIEYRWADGNYERFPALVAELLALKVDVIVTAGTPAALAVKKATTTVPLVMVAVGDPVGTGLVPSLARPGGNLTGFTNLEFTVYGKMLETLKLIAPAATRMALIFNSDNPSSHVYVPQCEGFTRALRPFSRSPTR